ncbi:MAG: branched-chain amino acid ABC transporter permease [Dehalococcoidales bacterium]
MKKSPKWLTYLPILIIIFIFVIPLLIPSPRYINLFIQLFLGIVLAMGVYSVWSVGFINAAQPIFYGLGAYVVTLLMIRSHFPYWLAFLGAGVIPGLVALLFGFVGLKMKGAYFLFLTIALNGFLSWLLVSWKSLFGGELGIFPVPHPEIRLFGLDINFVSSRTPYYYLALILAVFTCLVYFKLYGSRLGRVWECIGKTEDLLSNTGISVFTQKQIAFSLSCFFAGLAGAIWAPYITIVTPSEFTLWQGITIVLGVLVGGIYSPLGAIIGTVFMAVLNLLFTYLPRATIQYQPMILGLILVLVLLFMPTGILGLYGRIKTGIKELTGKKTVPVEINKTTLT